MNYFYGDKVEIYMAPPLPTRFIPALKEAMEKADFSSRGTSYAKTRNSVVGLNIRWGNPEDNTLIQAEVMFYGKIIERYTLTAL